MNYNCTYTDSKAVILVVEKFLCLSTNEKPLKFLHQNKETYCTSKTNDLYTKYVIFNCCVYHSEELYTKIYQSNYCKTLWQSKSLK